MGCCDSRPKRFVEKDINPVFDSAETASTTTHRTDPAPATNIPEISSFEEEINWLLSQSHWVSHIERSDYSVKTAPGSKSSSATPVCLACLEVDRLVSRTALIQALIHPEIRTSWDATVVVMEELQKNQLRVVKRYPFINREFIVQVTVEETEAVTTIKMHSDAEAQADSPDLVRGFVHFSVYRITEDAQKTNIVCVQQIRHNTKGAREFPSLVATELAQWVLQFKRYIKSLT